jgi:hypothetical protein
LARSPFRHLLPKIILPSGWALQGRDASGPWEQRPAAALPTAALSTAELFCSTGC